MLKNCVPDSPDVRRQMSFILTYSNWSTFSLLSWSVKQIIFSTHFSMPCLTASSRLRVTWLETLMRPGGEERDL